MIWWIACITEFVGVFLLAVEAIKLPNLLRLRQQLGFARNIVNPQLKLVEGSGSPPSFARQVGSFAGLVVLMPIVLFVNTPLLLVIMALQRVLEKIEANAPNGLVGLTGFSLWMVSFILNKFVLM